MGGPEFRIYKNKTVFSLFVCFAILAFELSSHLSYSTSPFSLMDFFEIGSKKLFASAGFEL
jgi:hypothetical protein